MKIGDFEVKVQRSVSKRAKKLAKVTKEALDRAGLASNFKVRAEGTREIGNEAVYVIPRKSTDEDQRIPRLDVFYANGRVSAEPFPQSLETRNAFDQHDPSTSNTKGAVLLLVQALYEEVHGAGSEDEVVGYGREVDDPMKPVVEYLSSVELAVSDMDEPLENWGWGQDAPVVMGFTETPKRGKPRRRG